MKKIRLFSTKATKGIEGEEEMVVEANGELKFKADQLIDEAYDKGYQAAIDNKSLLTEREAVKQAETKYERGYQYGYQGGFENGKLKGMEIAWDAARKIAADTEFSPNVLYEIFGWRSVVDVFMDNSARDAINKIREYEEKQETEQATKRFKEKLNSGYYGEKYSI